MKEKPYETRALADTAAKHLFGKYGHVYAANYIDKSKADRVGYFIKDESQGYGLRIKKIYSNNRGGALRNRKAIIDGEIRAGNNTLALMKRNEKVEQMHGKFAPK